MKEQINNDQEKLKQELQQLQDTVKQHQDDIQKLVTNNYTYFIHCYILLNPHSLGKITAPVFVTKYCTSCLYHWFKTVVPVNHGSKTYIDCVLCMV